MTRASPVPINIERGAGGQLAWVRRYALALGALDGLSALAAGGMAQLLRFGPSDVVLARPGIRLPYLLITIGFVPTWIGFMAFGGAYDRRVVGLGADEYRRVLNAALRVLALVAVTAYIAELPLARGFVGIILPTAAGLTLAGRRVARRRLHRRRAEGRYCQQMIVIGSEQRARELIRHLRRAPYAGFAVVGACVPGELEELDVDGQPVPVVGRPDEAEEVVRRLAADAVAVADTASLNGALRRLAWSLEGRGVDLVVAPALTDLAGPRIVVRPVAGLPLLHVDEPRLSGLQRAMKEVFDRAFAAVALTILSPLLFAAAVGIRMTSQGPAFFKQVRVGQDGRQFVIRKFRTMREGAELELLSLFEHNEQDGLLFKMKDDPRRTTIGRWLRRFSIDELPQLMNVIRGDMSVVGPRPPLPEEVERYDDHVRRRLLVKPGLTGLWQVSGRSDLPWTEAVRLDLYYVENWSPALDATILWKTVAAVVRGRGAY